jgi:hypothetical protein
MRLERRERGDNLAVEREGGNLVGDHLLGMRYDLEDRLTQLLERRATRSIEGSRTGLVSDDRGRLELHASCAATERLTGGRARASHHDEP